ncbi:MAG: hypothetical protein ACRCY9_11065, partial [Phycicoccus sp.]
MRLLVRLRFAMWLRAMSRSALHLVSSVAGVAVAVAALAVGVPSLALLAAAPLRVTAGTVPLFAGLTLAWVVFGVVAAGVDNLLDPARFALLPVRAPELARGLLAAALTGVPAVATAGLALGQAAAWLTRPAAFAAALVAAVLGTVTAVLLARAVTGALAGLMTSHVGRVAGAAVVAVVTVLPLAANLVFSGGSIVVDSAALDLSTVAVVVSWTPVGWVWALPLDVATGRWAAAAAHLFLAATLIVLLWRVWVGRLEQVLTAPPTAGGGHRIGRARVLPVILGRSPAATVAARHGRCRRPSEDDGQHPGPADPMPSPSGRWRGKHLLQPADPDPPEQHEQSR